MIDQDAPTGGPPFRDDEPCYFLSVGLIVTGKGERDHIPKLFRSLLQTGICKFEVIRFTGQRSPIRSETVKARMVGTGQLIPDKDAIEIGFPARTYLQSGSCRFVILLDDLEYGRRNEAQEIFDRYCRAFDSILLAEQRPMSSVHFLANMLEAYYFADANAINAIFAPPYIEDYDGDVETIRNPKAELKRLHPAFDEKEDAGRLLEELRVEHILSNCDACAYLRTLFAWCVKAMQRCEFFDPSPLSEAFCLEDGILSDITKFQ